MVGVYSILVMLSLNENELRGYPGLSDDLVDKITTIDEVVIESDRKALTFAFCYMIEDLGIGEEDISNDGYYKDYIRNNKTLTKHMAKKYLQLNNNSDEDVQSLTHFIDLITVGLYHIDKNTNKAETDLNLESLCNNLSNESNDDIRESIALRKILNGSAALQRQR